MKRVAVTVALVLTGSLGIARLQPRLARVVHDVKQTDDVYAFPPPGELRAMTLGYRAATADALWAKLLVEYGTHFAEHREFRESAKYMDAILTLEPGFPLVFKYAETLIVFRPMRGTLEDWYTAKAMLERGIRERPNDNDVWLHYGQFMAFSAPSFVKDQTELEGLRREGAKAIMRAVELGADPDRSVSAATLLSKYGERDAAIRQLKRAYALADSDADRLQIARKLQVLNEQATADEAARERRTIEDRWRRDFAFLAKDAYLLLGPVTDPFLCAGRAREGCPRDFAEVLTELPR